MARRLSVAAFMRGSDVYVPSVFGLFSLSWCLVGNRTRHLTNTHTHAHRDSRKHPDGICPLFSSLYPSKYAQLDMRGHVHSLVAPTRTSSVCAAVFTNFMEKTMLSRPLQVTWYSMGCNSDVSVHANLLVCLKPYQNITNVPS